MSGLDKTLEILQRELLRLRRERETLDAAILRVEDATRMIEGGAPGLTVAFRRKPTWTPAARRAAKRRIAENWKLVRKAGGRSLADLAEARRILARR
jgi:hypothetical protein